MKFHGNHPFLFSILTEEDQNLLISLLIMIFPSSFSFSPFVTSDHIYPRKGQRTWISKCKCFLMSSLNISLWQWCPDHDQKAFSTTQGPWRTPMLLCNLDPEMLSDDTKKHLHLGKWRMRALMDARWYQFRIKTETRLCVVEHEYEATQSYCIDCSCSPRMWNFKKYGI